MKINLLTGCLIAGILSLAALASCGGGSDEPEPDRGAAVTVTAPAGYVGLCGANVLMPVDGTIDYYENHTADIKMKGLKPVTGSGGVTYSGDLIIPGLPWKALANGIRAIDQKAITDVGAQMTVEAYSGDIPATAIAADGATVFSFEYSQTASAVRSHVYIPARAVSRGTTRISSASGVFTSDETSYLITVKEDGSADLTLHNAKFAQNMPPVGDMLFPSLALEVTADGFVLTSASLIPSIGGVPFPSFAITELRMEVDLEELGDADLTFVCNVFGQPHTVTASDMTCCPVGK